jgi:hypothetical protein
MGAADRRAVPAELKAQVDLASGDVEPPRRFAALGHYAHIATPSAAASFGGKNQSAGNHFVKTNPIPVLEIAMASSEPLSVACDGTRASPPLGFRPKLRA